MRSLPFSLNSLENTLIFIGNQSSEDSTEFSNSFFATTNPNTKFENGDTNYRKSEFNETGNSKDEEQTIEKIKNSNPSFWEKMFSRETFQEEAISFIHQSVYDWVLLASVGKVDPLFLAVLVMALVKILIPKNDK